MLSLKYIFVTVLLFLSNTSLAVKYLADGRPIWQMMPTHDPDLTQEDLDELTEREEYQLFIRQLITYQNELQDARDALNRWPPSILFKIQLGQIIINRSAKLNEKIRAILAIESKFAGTKLTPKSREARIPSDLVGQRSAVSSRRGSFSDLARTIHEEPYPLYEDLALAVGAE